MIKLVDDSDRDGGMGRCGGREMSCQVCEANQGIAVQCINWIVDDSKAESKVDGSNLASCTRHSESADHSHAEEVEFDQLLSLAINACLEPQWLK